MGVAQVGACAVRVEADDPGVWRFRGTGVGRVDGSGVTAPPAAAPSKGKLSRDAVMVAVKSIVVDR